MQPGRTKSSTEAAMDSSGMDRQIFHLYVSGEAAHQRHRRGPTRPNQTKKTLKPWLHQGSYSDYVLQHLDLPHQNCS